MANCNRCPRRLLMPNTHTTESMEKQLLLPIGLHRLFARRLGLLVLTNFLLLAPSPAQNDRPPWARKSKAAGNSPAASNDSAEPGQDRARIRVKVDLVSVLVSVL